MAKIIGIDFAPVPLIYFVQEVVIGFFEMERLSNITIIIVENFVVNNALNFKSKLSDCP